MYHLVSIFVLLMCVMFRYWSFKEPAFYSFYVKSWDVSPLVYCFLCSLLLLCCSLCSLCFLCVCMCVCLCVLLILML